MKNLALAGVAQWTKCWPENAWAPGSIPSQSTYVDRGPGPL